MHETIISAIPRVIFTGAMFAALAMACPARGDTHTWIFHATVDQVFVERGGSADLNGTLPLGSDLTYRYTFTTPVPGEPIDFASWIYPYDSTQTSALCTFGPYTIASNPSSNGSFTVIDDSVAGNNIIFAWVDGFTQTSGPLDLGGGCEDLISASMQWALGSLNPNAVVGTQIPATPFDLSMADTKYVNINFRTCTSQISVFATINRIDVVGSICEEIEAIIALVQSSSIHPGTKQSLMAKLNGLPALLCDSNPNNDVKARGPLQAFLNEVAAQSGKKIPTVLAGQLTSGGQQILGQIPK